MAPKKLYCFSNSFCVLFSSYYPFSLFCARSYPFALCSAICKIIT